MPDTVSLTIDERKVTVPAGTLVIDAARTLGIEIPTFCSHPKLDPLGACRMCLVEFVGPRGSKVDVSCTVPAAEGMVVRTNTPEVAAARRGVLACLLANHPLDCPICDKGGECPLQDQTLAFGPGTSQFVEVKEPKQKNHPVSRLILLDQERCVLCWRCIRYLEEWEGASQLGLVGRGDHTALDVFPGQTVEAHTSGNIIDICPVGALTNRVARFNYRPWQLTETPSVCNLCAVGCNIRLDERVHQIRRVVARENTAVNDQWICDKGRFVHGFIDHADRLKSPMIKENGALRTATWDEAISRAVALLNGVVASAGPAAVGGIASARASNEALYLFQKLCRSLLGSNNVDTQSGSSVRTQPAGLSSLREIGQSDLLVLVGLDPAEQAPILDLHIKRAVRRRGAKLVVIHARRIASVRGAGAYLPLRPGSEPALLNGLSAAVLTAQEGSGKGKGPGPSLDQWSWLRGAPASAPAAMAAAAGVPQAALATAVDLLRAARRPLFLYGATAATGSTGQAVVAAIQNLATLVGYPDRVGYVANEANAQGAQDMGVLPDRLPGQIGVGDAAVRERMGRLWGVPPPSQPGLSCRQMLAGGVRGLLIMGEDVAGVPQVASALRGLDALVVQDMFLSATAQLADVVLPAASFAEGEGTYTNLERRVQRAAKAIREVGESRPDWLILTQLANAWINTRATEQAAVAEPASAEADWKKKKRRVSLSRDSRSAPKTWNYPSASAVWDEIGRAIPACSTLRWESLGAAGIQIPPESISRGVRRVEPIATDPVPGALPGKFWLASAPVLWDASELMQHAHELVRQLIPIPFVALHPSDLAATGLADGSQVVVSTTLAETTLVLHGDDAVQPGTAWIPLRLSGLPAEALGAGNGDAVRVSLRAV